MQNNNAMNIELFEQYRPLLFSLAYRMLGTVTEAEDILQDAYLRWQNRSSEPIHNPKYYLTTIVTRLCLNVLSSARIQRETYMGSWLPEPVFTSDMPVLVNPVERVMMQDSISMAFLLLLESLSPAERAVFILHKVFDYKYTEIADILGKRETACRQLGRRAKQHIVANRPRFETTPAQLDLLMSNFIETVETGAVEDFLAFLAEDITLVPDGGGQRGAAIRILNGREAVSAFILGTRRIAPENLRYAITTLNGQQAILARTASGRPFFAIFLYGTEQTIYLMHVVAGRKLAGLKNR